MRPGEICLARRADGMVARRVENATQRTMGGRALTDNRSMIQSEGIRRSILVIRGHNVLLDADLAALYGVETRALVQAVQRNPARFPGDFMFRLTKEEFAALRSQIVISKPGRGGRRALPYAYRTPTVRLHGAGSRHAIQRAAQ